jgi:hypothetical protein
MGLHQIGDDAIQTLLGVDNIAMHGVGVEELSKQLVQSS